MDQKEFRFILFLLKNRFQIYRPPVEAGDTPVLVFPAGKPGLGEREKILRKDKNPERPEEKYGGNKRKYIVY
jgi:hypothetical protein